jgi:L-threonylcarbamoyladenylate synthase
MRIYRPGAVTAAQIEAAAGPVEIFQHQGPLLDATAEGAQNQEIFDNRTALPSPGVSLRHYAPKARLILLEGAASELPGKLAEAAAHWPGERIGLLLPADLTVDFTPHATFPWGRWAAPKELAQGLYAGLRALDSAGCTVILAPLPAADGIGAAIRDRMRKAGNSGK